MYYQDENSAMKNCVLACESKQFCKIKERKWFSWEGTCKIILVETNSILYFLEMFQWNLHSIQICDLNKWRKNSENLSHKSPGRDFNLYPLDYWTGISLYSDKCRTAGLLKGDNCTLWLAAVFYVLPSCRLSLLYWQWIYTTSGSRSLTRLPSITCYTTHTNFVRNSTW